MKHQIHNLKRSLIAGLLFWLGGGGVYADFQEENVYLKKLEIIRLVEQSNLKEWKQLANKGDAEAQYNLGRMYYWGIVVTQDYKEALEWTLLSAEQGAAKAQIWLGTMYEQGKGVTQDDEEAEKWYRLAAEQGYILVQPSLGGDVEIGRIKNKSLSGYTTVRDSNHCLFAVLTPDGLHLRGDDFSDFDDRDFCGAANSAFWMGHNSWPYDVLDGRSCGNAGCSNAGVWLFTKQVPYRLALPEFYPHQFYRTNLIGLDDHDGNGVWELTFREEYYCGDCKLGLFDKWSPVPDGKLVFEITENGPVLTKKIMCDWKLGPDALADIEVRVRDLAKDDSDYDAWVGLVAQTVVDQYYASGDFEIAKQTLETIWPPMDSIVNKVEMPVAPQVFKKIVWDVLYQMMQKSHYAKVQPEFRCN